MNVHYYSPNTFNRANTFNNTLNWAMYKELFFILIEVSLLQSLILFQIVNTAGSTIIHIIKFPPH